MKKKDPNQIQDIGFAKIDHGREIRKGAPEVIFCQNKTPEQVLKISQAILDHGSVLLGTRLAESSWIEIKEKLPSGVKYDPISRTISFVPKKLQKKHKGYVAIVSAGTSDMPVAEEAAITTETLGSRVVRVYDAGVAGIHRIMCNRHILEKANAIVVVAGMEGALPSVVGGLVSVPVIACPTSVGYGASFGGLAALLGMLNTCASGVTVVNIDNGFGAGYAAHQINRMVAK
jgi:NCAIR mutase (PurE)-related protein